MFCLHHPFCFHMLIAEYFQVLGLIHWNIGCGPILGHEASKPRSGNPKSTQWFPCITITDSTAHLITIIIWIIWRFASKRFTNSTDNVHSWECFIRWRLRLLIVKHTYHCEPTRRGCSVFFPNLHRNALNSHTPTVYTWWTWFSFIIYNSVMIVLS